MLIRSVSDIHIEHLRNVFTSPNNEAQDYIDAIIPQLDTDSQTTLVIAGDLGVAIVANQITTFLSYVLPRFKYVIYVLGNHEHYQSNMDDTLPLIRRATNELPGAEKLYIVGNQPERIELDDAVFICSTLWTDYGKHTSNVKVIRSTISHGIADHHVIYTANGRASPEYLASIFDASSTKIDALLSETNNKKTVVVTHHLPTFRAIHPQFTLSSRDRMMNHAFASELDPIIINREPSIWIFGHTHCKYSEYLGRTRLHCNPHGYPREVRGRYDSTEVLEV